MRLPVHQSSRSLKKDTYLIWKKCDEPRIFFEKDNNTFRKFKERNKQKDNKLKVIRLPRQRSRSLAKIIFFEKRQHNTLADILFFSPEENEKKRNYYQKMPTVQGIRRKIPDLVLYHQTTILTTLKKFFIKGNVQPFQLEKRKMPK